MGQAKQRQIQRMIDTCGCEDKTETEILREIRVVISRLPGCVFWRNNAGVDTDRGVRYGLAVGSADLIGIVDGRFVALECKSARGRSTAEQDTWGALVRKYGGHYAIVRSVEDAMKEIENARRRK